MPGGQALLVEKPLATSLAAARHIASLVSPSGVRAMVAHTLRFNVWIVGPASEVEARDEQLTDVFLALDLAAGSATT